MLVTNPSPIYFERIVMKDYEIAILHNKLADCARRFANTQQLRSRLVSVIAPLIKKIKDRETWTIRPIKEFPSGAIDRYELEIPNVPCVLQIRGTKTGSEPLMGSTFQRVRKITLIVEGEIKVPPDIELLLIE